MFKIGNREVSDKNNPLIIPENWINHNGSLSQAIKIVDAAYKAGAEIRGIKLISQRMRCPLKLKR